MASKKPKTHSKTWYRKHAIALAKESVRSKGFCEWCGRTEGQLHGSHIFPDCKRFDVVAANELNIVALCPEHHKFGAVSWHQSPVHGVKWLQQKYPGRIEQLERIIEAEKEIDWVATYEYMKGQRA